MTKDEYVTKLEEILDDCFEAEPAGYFDYEKAITAIQQLNNEAMPNKTIGAPVGEYDTGGECGAYADGYNQLRQELRAVIGDDK